MAKIELSLTAFEQGVTKDIEGVDDGFGNMIFGTPDSGQLIGGNEIVVEGIENMDTSASTGDFFASATMVVGKDGLSELRFKAPEINEEKAVSPDDAVIIDVANETDPARRKMLQEMANRAAPIKHLARRYKFLQQNFASTMATEGKIEHHKGTLDVGFSAVVVLGAGNWWSEATVSPVSFVEDIYDSMDKKPDAVFLGTEAKTQFVKDARASRNDFGDNPDFEFATMADADRLSPKTLQRDENNNLVMKPSKTTIYIGRIVSKNLSVYHEMGSKIDVDGAKTVILPTKNILFAPVNNRQRAQWYFASIPRTEIVNGLGAVAKWENTKYRWYNFVSDNGVTGGTGVLTSFAPIAREPDAFARYQVLA